LKNLQDILYGVSIKDVVGSTDILILNIEFDSRKVNNGCLFVALKGSASDGHDFIDSAIRQGAKVILCERKPQKVSKEIVYVITDNSHKALGVMASNYYDNPSHKIKLIGVTGTNGKTSVATLLYRTFVNMGHGVGLISTVNYMVNEDSFPSSHTTPDPLRTNELLNKMIESSCTYCFMEVSSHAIDQERISGLKFLGAVFTNITHDHLDYHGTFDAYIKTKKRLFDSLSKGAFALYNKDDKRGEVMVQNTKAKPYSFGLKSIAEYKVKVLENTFEGLLLNVQGEDVYVSMTGKFNAYNLLAVYATSVILGEDHQEVLKSLSILKPAEGRFDHFLSDKKLVGVVDYAHTPDALKQVLSTIHNLRKGHEKIYTIIGCGGDRDKQKRALMGQIAAALSDMTILTSDNPRSEKPESIIDEMKAGISITDQPKTLCISDRKEAIKTACVLAGAGDIILLAGKGHEKTQEIKGVKHPFDDKLVLIDCLKELNK
jgi:UDP-N-acetylmuramoyl-L-alanyl-D-glutamate--2,6-diaminopimelate ligase